MHLRAWHFARAIVATAIVAVSAPAAAAIITVTTTADNEAVDGFCSLREALIAANTNQPYVECPGGDGADRIVFDLPTPATISLVADLPQITDSLRISGPGPLQLAIDGIDTFRLLDFDTAGGGLLVVEELTLRNGRAPGTLPGGDGGGASIAEGETARFERVRFLENRSLNAGGGLAIASSTVSPATVEVLESLFQGNVAEGPIGGGGLAVNGTGASLNVSGSTFRDNEATNAAGVGGGLSLYRATVTVERSTVSGNHADSGGGVHFQVSGSSAVSGTLRVVDSTVTSNVANADGDADGDGGGIRLFVGAGQTGSFELVNSVVAGNVDSGAAVLPDLFCSPEPQLLASGASFVGSNEGCATLFPAGEPNVDGAWVGTNVAPLDPELEPLAANGGGLPTHAPSVTTLTPPVVSPLIDHGQCAGALTDQRGYGNPANLFRRLDVPEVPNGSGSDGCDIGAVEINASPIQTPPLFSDGFESGTTLLWSGEAAP